MAQKLDNRPESYGSYDDGKPSWYKPSGDNEDFEQRFKDPSASPEDLPENHPDRKSMNPDELQDAEESANAPGATMAERDEQSAAGLEDDHVGSGFRHEGDKKPKRGRLSRNQKIVGGGALGIVGGGGIIFLLFFVPILRLESYMQTINKRAFAYTASAIEARTGHLFERYMITHAINLERCGAVASTACRADYTNKGMAAGLFNGWRDARLEQKLLDRYGWEIKSLNNPDRSAGANRFEIIDKRNGNPVMTLTNGHLQEGNFTGGSRELGREIRLFLKQETRLIEVMHRKSVRKYLARKHNVKLWCFFACKTRDNIELRAADAKTRYKYRFVERFVFPFSGKYGLIMNCIISGTPGSGKCSSEELAKKGIDRERIPDETVTKILADFENSPNLRLSQVVTENLLGKIMKPQATKVAVSSIPIVGQAYLGMWAFDMLYRADSFLENNGLSQMAADLNSAQYLEYYTGMRSVNDEMKSHVLALDEVGAVLSDFEGAEESLVYQNYNIPSVASSKLGRKAYAQAAQSEGKEPYVCANGKAVPADEQVCAEKKIGREFAIEDIRGNRVVDGLSDGFFSTYECAVPKLPFINRCPPGMAPKTYVQGTIKTVDMVSESVFGPILGGILSIAGRIPGVGHLMDFAKDKSSDLIMALFGKVFPLPVNVDSPGREKYDAIEAGADVAASEFAEGGYTDAGESYGLGAPALSDEQAEVVYRDYLEQQEHEFKNAGLFARLTNPENPKSLASHFIMNAPINPEQAAQGFANGFLNAFSNIGNVFASLATPSRIGAESLAQQQLSINAFGVTRYGYPLNDSAYTRDPALLTPKYCKAARAAREASLTKDPLTGFSQYSVADPCLLEQVAIEAAGAFFTND